MKKALVAIAALLISVSAYAQGQINFNTHVGTGASATVDARVFNPDGSAAIAGYGQLFIVNGAGSTATYTPLVDLNGGATAFRTSAAGAGYFNGGGVTAPSAGGTYNIVLRAWQGAAGSTYDSATVKGQSAVLSVVLTEAPAIPNDLVGLTGFTMTPEPTTMALGALGLGALLLYRRKA
jgi:MYXO-CTERM domain-containing protein